MEISPFDLSNIDQITNKIIKTDTLNNTMNNNNFFNLFTNEKYKALNMQQHKNIQRSIIDLNENLHQNIFYNMNNIILNKSIPRNNTNVFSNERADENINNLISKEVYNMLPFDNLKNNLQTSSQNYLNNNIPNNTMEILLHYLENNIRNLTSNQHPINK